MGKGGIPRAKQRPHHDPRARRDPRHRPPPRARTRSPPTSTPRPTAPSQLAGLKYTSRARSGTRKDTARACGKSRGGVNTPSPPFCNPNHKPWERWRRRGRAECCVGAPRCGRTSAAEQSRRAVRYGRGARARCCHETSEAECGIGLGLAKGRAPHDDNEKGRKAVHEGEFWGRLSRGHGAAPAASSAATSIWPQVVVPA